MEEQEVELVDYLNVIWKWKGLIIGGTLLAAATALVVSLSMAKTYEVSRTLKIGNLPSVASGKGGQVEKREDVIGRLQDHRVLTKTAKDLLLELTPEQLANSIVVDTLTNPNVRYVVRVFSPQLAVQIADWLAQSIISVHRRLFESQLQVVKAYEGELEGKMHDIEEEIVLMKSTVRKLIDSRGNDSVILVVLRGNIRDRERQVANLRRELNMVRLSRLTSENTTVISADEPPTHPITPKVEMNVALAGIMGLMVFTFLAFFLEYLEKTGWRPGKYKTE